MKNINLALGYFTTIHAFPYILPYEKKQDTDPDKNRTDIVDCRESKFDEPWGLVKMGGPAVKDHHQNAHER